MIVIITQRLYNELKWSARGIWYQVQFSGLIIATGLRAISCIRMPTPQMDWENVDKSISCLHDDSQIDQTQTM
jgi:hypothetical protein